jgi:hypothetical protein
MRDDLGAILDELEPRPAPAGMLEAAGLPPAVERPSIAKRGELWTLAIKLGRELGTEIDARPPAAAAPTAGGPAKGRRRKVDMG